MEFVIEFEVVKEIINILSELPINKAGHLLSVIVNKDGQKMVSLVGARQMKKEEENADTDTKTK